MGKGAKLAIWIVITLISLAFLAYNIGTNWPEVQRTKQEADQATKEMNQAVIELQKAYDECIAASSTVSEKEQCNSMVTDPRIHKHS
jgi:hypothetical protein